VVLSGINLGRWGREPGSSMRLAGLIRRLLDETEIARLRLSSVEPMDFSDDLLSLMAASPRIARHVHAPLQTGSDRILRRMHRKYRPRHYADRIFQARRLMPDCAVGADVMVGFPGETEADFEESRRFIEGLPFTYLHVFTYSERPGTPAAEMPDQVPMPIRKERNRILRELAASKNLAFRRAMLGRTLCVVTLNAAPNENGKALSGNYLRDRRHHGKRPARNRESAGFGDFAVAGSSTHLEPFALELPRRGNDLAQVRIARLPPQRAAQFVRVGHQRRRVALAPRADGVGRLQSGRLLHPAKHFQHRVPISRPHVELVGRRAGE
jgi:MiaB/RimO family radical SAM methylthiotransferase